MSKIKPNILMSVNENPLYAQFVPLVCSAWRNWGYKVHLYVVSDNRSKMEWTTEYADHVFLHNKRGDMDEGVWTKLCRIWGYTTPEYEYQVVSDIDLLPLKREYFDQMSNWDEMVIEDKILSFSHDSHKDLMVPEGGKYHKFAGCYMMAKGSTWNEIVNPQNLPLEEWIKWLKTLPKLDHKQDISQPANVFSEESLIRAMVYLWDKDRKRVVGFNRGFKSGHLLEDRLERSKWHIDMNKLYGDYYVDAHLPRPLGKNTEAIRPLVEYLGLDPNLLTVGIEKMLQI